MAKADRDDDKWNVTITFTNGEQLHRDGLTNDVARQYETLAFISINVTLVEVKHAPEGAN